jgi:hypothetical protein
LNQSCLSILLFKLSFELGKQSSADGSFPVDGRAVPVAAGVFPSSSKYVFMTGLEVLTAGGIVSVAREALL